MTKRSRLPNRRASESFSIEVGGLKYIASISLFDDGRLGEVFLNATNKAGSALDDAARDAAAGPPNLLPRAVWPAIPINPATTPDGELRPIDRINGWYVEDPE